MVTIRLLSAVVLSLALAACAGKGTSSSGGSEGEDLSLDESGAEGTTKARAGNQNGTAPSAPSAAVAVASTALGDAIRAQNDEAIYKTATHLLSQNSNDLKALNALGLYHYKKGRYLAAMFFFNRALQSHPDSSEVYSNIGLAQLGLKEQRDGIRSFRKALELNPNNVHAAANLGSIYVQNKEYSKAVFALEIANRNEPKDIRNLVNYGVALVGTGKYDQAKAQYEQALRINSTSRETLYNFAVVEIDFLKKYSNGLDLLNKLKFLGPPDSLRNRINALENKAKTGLQ